MISVKFVRTIHNCNSIIEANTAIEIVEKQISNMLQNKNVDYIKRSQAELFVTLIVNPTQEELQDSHKHSESIFSILSTSLDGDTYLYSVRNRLGQLTIPPIIEKLLIAIGLSEFKIDSSASTNYNEGEDEKPIFYAKNPKWSFNDIILNEETKERIYRALSIIKNKDIIFSDWGFSSIDKATKSIICFYGPAGTGKTMTAEAIGTYLNKRIVHSSYAEIESKWVGEGAKNLHAIFKFAEENDSILFFDEADSFLSSRIENTESSSDKHYNRMSNELFQLLEEFNGCVIFSTNLLKDVDEAFKSRIIDSIKFELPDASTRIMLIKKMIPPQFPMISPISDEEYEILAERINGFSGRDIRKSVLLSLAGAAIKNQDNSIGAFSFEDIAAGFEEVLKYKNLMISDNEEIPTEIVENLVKKQKLNENIVDMAIYAMLSDGVIHDKERELLNQLSMALLGCAIKEPIEKPYKTLEQICKGTNDNLEKKVLIETAIRVITIDGIVKQGEIEFIDNILNLMEINNDTTCLIKEYYTKLASLNSDWSNLQLK